MPLAHRLGTALLPILQGPGIRAQIDREKRPRKPKTLAYPHQFPRSDIWRGWIATAPSRDATARSAQKKGPGEDQSLEYLVGRGGFEPPTNGLKVRCSTS